MLVNNLVSLRTNHGGFVGPFLSTFGEVDCLLFLCSGDSFALTPRVLGADLNGWLPYKSPRGFSGDTGETLSRTSTQNIRSLRVGDRRIFLLALFLMPFHFSGCGGLGGENNTIDFGHLSFESLIQIHPELFPVADIFDENNSELQSKKKRTRQLALFAKVFSLAQREYVETLPSEELISGALDGVKTLETARLKVEEVSFDEKMAEVLRHMMSGLDAHSDYLTPADYDQIQIRTRGHFGGVGIEMTMEDGLVKCIAALEDTPAQRAGVRSGDLITHVDGKSVLGMSLMQIVEKMRGSPGSWVVLRILRGLSSEPFDVKLLRQVIRIKPVSARVEGDIGYVRISAFSERTHRSLNSAITGLSGELQGRMVGLVIDLRDNPGGLFEQALKVSDAFLTEGEIVSTIGREKDRVSRFSADPDDIASGIPIAVLINGASASASEIVSGALKDHGRAVIFGERSVGKGSVQTVIPLGQGEGAVRLTTARYYTPSGQSIQVHGIEPDIVFAQVNPPQREKDLENPLSAEGQGNKTYGLLLDTVCPGAGGHEDPVLSCALDVLRN